MCLCITELEQHEAVPGKMKWEVLGCFRQSHGVQYGLIPQLNG